MELYRSHDTLFGLVNESYDGTLTHARAVIIPAPLEYTVSYGTGTGGGPAAILAASTQMELYDEELGSVPATHGISTLASLDFTNLPIEAALGRIEEAVAAVLNHEQLPVTLGGEHSLTPACVRAVQAAADFAPLGVVQFDAHGDLRMEYEGSPYSHASAMRRTLEIPHVELLEVGIRSISEGEIADLASGAVHANILYAHQLAAGEVDFTAALAALPTRVYITIDVDGFDPAYMPATGTPEPGGLGWYSVLRMLRLICATKTVVGVDVVELAPIPGLHAPDFLVAKLVYRLLGAYFAEKTETMA
jgi:agmatinase